MASEQAQVELETDQQKTVPVNPPEEVPDYDDESGVYLGPGRTFDDEDLEYLNKDVEEQMSIQRVEEAAPASPLIVDSVSGIYLGFEDKEEEDSETEDAEGKAESEEDTDPEDTVKSSSKMFAFFKRKSKYEVNSDDADLDLEAEDGHCFKFIRKVWRKAEVCQ